MIIMEAILSASALLETLTLSNNIIQKGLAFGRDGR
jgi:hypothetical protein